MARGVGGGLFEGGNYFRYFHDGYFSRKYVIPMWKGLSSSDVIAPTLPVLKSTVKSYLSSPTA